MQEVTGALFGWVNILAGRSYKSTSAVVRSVSGQPRGDIRERG